MTHNEPWVIAHHGYETADHAPLQKLQGYKAGHNLIRAHTKAYRVYERKYKNSQKGTSTVNHLYNDNLYNDEIHSNDIMTGTKPLPT